MRFPTQDLSERLLGNGGRTQRGLFLPNRYRGDGRRGGGRGRGMSPIEQLRQMLRTFVLHTRPPSHIAPPFRAEQWLFQSAIPGAAASEQPVTFNGNTSIPNGTNGVMSFLSVVFSSFNRDVLVDPWDFGVAGTPALFTVKKNQSPIPGLNQFKPQAIYGELLTDIAGSNVQLGAIPLPLTVPVILRAGDTMQVAYNGFGGATGDIAITIAGYTYPVEIESDGIYGTLVDRT